MSTENSYPMHLNTATWFLGLTHRHEAALCFFVVAYFGVDTPLPGHGGLAHGLDPTSKAHSVEASLDS